MTTRYTKEHTRNIDRLLQTNFPFSRLSAVMDRKKTANDIDESQDGVIERMEWMRYTAVLDEGSGESIGIPICAQIGTVQFALQQRAGGTRGGDPLEMLPDNVWPASLRASVHFVFPSSYPSCTPSGRVIVRCLLAKMRRALVVWMFLHLLPVTLIER